MSKRKPPERSDPNQARPSTDDFSPVEPPFRMPLGGARLKKGDRVEFDIGQGVDGPPYAISFSLIDDE